MFQAPLSIAFLITSLGSHTCLALTSAVSSEGFNDGSDHDFAAN
jgi:hypothetical protein